jgi:hypothetical protein
MRGVDNTQLAQMVRAQLAELPPVRSSYKVPLNFTIIDTHSGGLRISYERDLLGDAEMKMIADVVARNVSAAHQEKIEIKDSGGKIQNVAALVAERTIK